jgi:eukaryotic-like serine/threonine-protein kinase
MTDSAIDRNLLFGVLALQLDFITRETFLAAMAAWVVEKAKPLGELLVERQSIGVRDFALLSAIAEDHVAHRGAASAKGLTASLGPLDVVQMDLAKLPDPEVQAALARLVAMQHLARGEEPTLPPQGQVEGEHSLPQSEARFELIKQHAWGGLGEVYVAYDRELHREVALKRLQERHAGSADSRIRFLLEAEITGGLEHPGIVPVYGMGMSDDGRPYYAMRFIRGKTLRAAIDEFHASTPVSSEKWRTGLRHLLGRFIAVCNAVDYAHSRGVIHRDLKPSNVMLGKFGETLVVDWGLAKASELCNHLAPGEERKLTPSSEAVSSETLPGSAIGTPGFMSPEQSEGRIADIGPSSDIYTLGVTLYLLLAGQEPFEGKSISELLAQVRKAEYAPPRQRNASVPAPLEAICLKAMKLSPKDRYATCGAMAKDIERWLDDAPVSAFAEPLSARLYRWIRAHRVLTARAGGLAAGLLAGLIVMTVLLSRANLRIAASALETENERVVATQQRDAATRQLYVSQMNLAQRAWEDNNASRTQELLEAQIPKKPGDFDGRDWEWRHLWRLSHSELRILNIKALCLGYSPDGKYLVSGGQDGKLRFWNPSGTQELRTIQAHEARINMLAFNRDGSLLVTGCRDGSAKFWNPASGRLLKTIKGYPIWEHGLAITPDGTRLAVSYMELVMYDATKGTLLHKLKGHTHFVEALTFTPDGRRLISGGWDRSVRLWDAASGNPLRKFPTVGSGSTAVVLSPDGQKLYSGTMEGDLQVFDLESGKELSRLKLHSSKINRLVFSPDGNRLASASDDTTVKIIDLRSRTDYKIPNEIETLRGHRSAVSDLAFSPGGDVIVTAGWDATIRFWDAASSQSPAIFKVPRSPRYTSVVYSPDGSTLAAGGRNATTAWDTATGEIRWTVPEMLSSFPAGIGQAMCFDPAGRLLASALDNGLGVQLRDPSDGRMLRRLYIRDAGDVGSTDFSPDGSELLAGYKSGRLVVWDPNNGTAIRQWPAHAHALNCAIFSPDGRYIATAGSESAKTRDSDDRVHLWDASDGRLIRRMVGHQGVICSLAFSPDGRHLFSGGRDQMIRLWDVETGTLERAWSAHSGDVQSLAPSPDGKRLFSGSDDHTMKIWDLSTTQEVQVWNPEALQILSVALTPDGTRLAAACPDTSRVVVWDSRPLTPERRIEIDASSLLTALAAQSSSETDLRDRIRKMPLIEEAVRARALSRAADDWRARVRAKSQEWWYWLQRLWPRKFE